MGGSGLVEIVIRRCGVEDAAVLALLGGATFLDAFSGMLPGRSIVEHCRVNHSAEAYAKYLSKPECRVWMAETVVEEGPVGYAMLTAPDLPVEVSGEDTELKRIYVLSRFHGSGTGKRLMEEAIAGARGMGKKRLLLGVHEGNERALGFYERAGFEVVGKRTFQMGFSVFEDLVLGLGL